jgi:hypothetical protein
MVWSEIGAAVGSGNEPFGAAVDAFDFTIHIPFLIRHRPAAVVAARKRLFVSSAAVMELAAAFVALRRLVMLFHILQDE